MDIQDKLKLITRNCDEIIGYDELKEKLESGNELQHYIGFEVSGLVHLGTGLVSMGKIADFLKAGIKCRIFLADYHSFLNNKMGGDWKKIRWATEHYFKKALIGSLLCFGVEEKEVEFVMAEEFYKNTPQEWENLFIVSKHITLSRNMRSISIMGKDMGNDVDMATLFYPPLQVADIFTMKIDLAHAGTDQRKAHVVARDVARKLKWNSPICIHHNLIAGLTGPEKGKENSNESLKMSKSKPNSAIYIHDTEEEIRNKIKKAYCPPQIIEFNPIIDYVKTIMFWGEETDECKKIIDDFVSGTLHPMDLKEIVANWLVEKLKPARDFFKIKENEEALIQMQKDCSPKIL